MLFVFEYDGCWLLFEYGFLMKLWMLIKFGYKNLKYIMEIFVIDMFLGGYWVD